MMGVGAHVTNIKGELHICISNILSKWSYIFSKNFILWANWRHWDHISFKTYFLALLSAVVLPVYLPSVNKCADAVVYSRLLRDRFFCITTWNIFLQLFKLCFNNNINSNVIILQYYYVYIISVMVTANTNVNALLVSDSYECWDSDGCSLLVCLQS